MKLPEIFRRDLAKIVLLFLGSAVFRYWNLITPNKEAREYILRDFVQNGQETAFLAGLKKGSLLLWDVSTGAGWPVNNAMSLFYPLNVLYLPFVRHEFIAHHVFQYFYVLHVSLMGVFAYLLLRELGATRLPAVVAGLIYSFNGYALVHSMQLGLINTMTWFPLVFMFMERARRLERLLPAAWGGVALGVAVLAAHAQIYYYMALAAALYAAFWAIAGWRSSAGFAARVRPLTQLVVLGSAAFGISAIQTIPAFWTGVESLHAAVGQEFKWRNPLNFYQLAMLVVPWGLEAVEDWNILVSERYAYMGWAALVFGLGALVWRREAKTYAYAAIAGIALILAMGDNSFLFKIFYDYVPGYGMFRYPSRVLVVFVFGMTVLAGLGLDRFLSDEDGREARERVPGILKVFALGGLGLWLAAVAALTATAGAAVHDRMIHFASQLGLALVVVWLWWGIAAAARNGWQTRGFGVGLVTVVLFDLWSPGSVGERVPSPDGLKQEEESAVAFLNARKRAGELFRIENHLLRESLLPRHGISAFNTDSRLMGGGYLELMWLAGKNPRLLDLMNVKYVVGAREEKGPKEERSARGGLYGNLDLGPMGSKTIRIVDTPARIDRIEIVSSIHYGGHIPQGDPVAEIEAWDKGGRSWRFPIRAGIETAEWAVDDPAGGVKHRVAQVAASWPMPGRKGIQGHAYRGLLRLPGETDLAQIELRYARMDGELRIKSLKAGGRDLADLPEDRYKEVASGILENRHVLPRAFFVPSAKVISNGEEMKRAIKWFDPERVVLLSKPPTGGSTIHQERADAFEGGQAKIVHYSPRKVSIDVTTPVQQVLVLSDTYHPWWRARINGNPVEVLKANLALRAVVVPPGKHRVEFLMVPVSLYWGMAITITTILALGGAAYRSSRANIRSIQRD